MTSEGLFPEDIFPADMLPDCARESVSEGDSEASKAFFEASKPFRSICSDSITKIQSSIVERTYFRRLSGEILDLISSTAEGLI
ncbi:hypothetical protein DSECCO2_641070 [anaerobic digester metagenome]